MTTPATTLPPVALHDTTGLYLTFLGAEQATLDGQTLKLRRRFCEILLILATNPNGLTGGQLSAALYGEWSDTQNQAVEVHRLSKLVELSSKPYRLVRVVGADFLSVQDLLMEGRTREAALLYRGELLPLSDAPAVNEYREYLHESIRQAALLSQELEPLWTLVARFPDDLELIEALNERLPREDVRRGMVQARMRLAQRRLCAS
ncbi:helix-turn-helix domain-containing protein [Deinococcus sp. HMF7604]|uniref:helix-turn-helix domain-containing protein n=1 Tax=Deinococcus betulae TaxID=2873312 RepID=UPI001CC99862|nr:helix-turn-helix domain-containing protein [Deinococcus betulae]MBZ9751528.1 helix-turn-helix domain-containing protein [Deinococcus betulae]